MRLARSSPSGQPFSASTSGAAQVAVEEKASVVRTPPGAAEYKVRAASLAVGTLTSQRAGGAATGAATAACTAADSFTDSFAASEIGGGISGTFPAFPV